MWSRMVVTRCVCRKGQISTKARYARARRHPVHQHDPMSHWAPAFAGVTGFSWTHDFSFDHSIESVSIQKSTLQPSVTTRGPVNFGENY